MRLMWNEEAFVQSLLYPASSRAVQSSFLPPQYSGKVNMSLDISSPAAAELMAMPDERTSAANWARYPSRREMDTAPGHIRRFQNLDINSRPNRKMNVVPMVPQIPFSVFVRAPSVKIPNIGIRFPNNGSVENDFINL